MLVPAGKLFTHVDPQSIPSGLLVTVPSPNPVMALLTVRMNLSPPPATSKTAVTVVLL
jgi:hypothetical protein